jgi:hypothetical protein
LCRIVELQNCKRSELNKGGNEYRVGSKFPHQFVDGFVFYPEASPFHSEYHRVLSIFRNDNRDALIESSPDLIDVLLMSGIAQVDQPGQRYRRFPVQHTIAGCPASPAAILGGILQAFSSNPEDQS